MSALRPLHCGSIGCLNDNDRARNSISKMTLNEFTHLTAALSYECNYGDISGRPFYNLRHQRRLTAPSISIDSDPLTFATRQKPIQHANAERKWLLDATPLHRVGCPAAERTSMDRLYGPLAIEWTAEAVDHATEQAGPD